MFSHTRGPWRVLCPKPRQSFLEITDKDGLIQIAEVGGNNRSANATLIAAAPSLLSALKDMVAEWEKITRYGSPIAKAANETVRFAREQIALAEGSP